MVDWLHNIVGAVNLELSVDLKSRDFRSIFNPSFPRIPLLVDAT